MLVAEGVSDVEDSLEIFSLFKVDSLIERFSGSMVENVFIVPVLSNVTPGSVVKKSSIEIGKMVDEIASLIPSV